MKTPDRAFLGSLVTGLVCVGGLITSAQKFAFTRPEGVALQKQVDRMETQMREDMHGLRDDLRILIGRHQEAKRAPIPHQKHETQQAEITQEQYWKVTKNARKAAGKKFFLGFGETPDWDVDDK